MKLKDLFRKAGVAEAWAANPDITGLAYDSRLVKPGFLFFAFQGAQVDGHNFIAQAFQNGAAAVVVEKAVASAGLIQKVPHVGQAMSALSHQFYGLPSTKIPVIGITGTNGKTTMTYLLEDALRVAGMSAGVMGTINYRVGDYQRPAPNTTPMSVDVHQFIAQALEQKARVVVMEVSSHALELYRVDTVQFSVGVFTNLTQDHLDFHKDMESYFNAKARLFRDFPGIKPVVNVDDPYGRRLADETQSAYTFGISTQAAFQALHPQCSLQGLGFELRFPSGRKELISTNLMGRHNISNLLGAAAALSALGVKEDDIIQGLCGNHAIPGRLERVDAGQDFVVVVDYAHTDDALLQVLKTLRDTKPRRLLCVFGAGGDRDKTKRPKMGKAAVLEADHVYVTSDNPRTENPEQILKDIEQGCLAAGKNNYELHVDRAQAIERALHDAQKNDNVLIAGKGHETTQIIGRTKFPFSDQQTALAVLKRR